MAATEPISLLEQVSGWFSAGFEQRETASFIPDPERGESADAPALELAESADAPTLERDESADAPTLEREEGSHRAGRAPAPTLERTESAAAAVEAFVEDAAKGKAEGWFASFGVDRLVDSPGSMEVIAQMWIFFAQKLSLQVNVSVGWPSWYLRALDALAIFQLDISFRGLGLDVPSACVTTA